MKQFSCGDIMPGCGTTIRAEHEKTGLAQVTKQANLDHRLPEVPAGLLEQVLSHMQEAPANA